MYRFDVVIVGSGPAGVATAEWLHDHEPTITIAVIERGPLLLRRHFYDSGGSVRDRDAFFNEHRECPWIGDLSEGGTLLPSLGGRGIVGGSQLHRFYSEDFTLWKNGSWPIDATQLAPYFSAAEARLLGSTRSTGPSQDFVCSTLAKFGARHPPSGPAISDPAGVNGGFSHRSSAERLLTLLNPDLSNTEKRIQVFPETVAIKLVSPRSNSSQVTYVRCVSARRSEQAAFDIGGSVFVLAASPVESARLLLVSDLADARSSSSTVGRYLTEHIYCRGHLDVSGNADIGTGTINAFLPPPGPHLDERYQIEMRSIAEPDQDRRIVRITGSAAMDPNRDNRVTLATSVYDGYGVPRASTTLKLSTGDQRRTQSMIQAMHDVATHLNGTWLTPPVVLPRGSSYHETGTLRMTAYEQESATDPSGLLRGTTNVFAGDGAAFASVGVANPILTITAMAYRLATALPGYLT
ncbi:GMC oxidoreductase [Amycolatopsis sp., V23-08]|uniref:GMC oxidoreductase n=1 Tax=Amycolatopsis heterodermiae TaxID=3110235 RepID=A0ABU5RLX6_9PSEU|nr:GMC oxidoreductase [Amycolatopsis sp., V23-08]MEA5367298.1 GMC oxidoreductase [Amycolatopsis sp., V23-08]